MSKSFLHNPGHRPVQEFRHGCSGSKPSVEICIVPKVPGDGCFDLLDGCLGREDCLLMLTERRWN